MMQTTIYVRASRAAVRQAIASIPTAARSGGEVADVMMTNCGMAALKRISDAFITKSRGGTDEAGYKWAPLSPVTIARRRKSTQTVDILRDTGLLLNTLSPGVVKSGFVGPLLSVFHVAQGEVILGTNRKGAKYHHSGTKRLPKRRLWPPPSRWPASWWGDIQDVAIIGLVDLVTLILKR